MMNKISKKDAKRMGFRRYYTGRPCKKGHLSERWISGKCIKCHHEYKLENDARIKEKRRQHRLEMKKSIQEYDRQYWIKNKDRISINRKNDSMIKEYQKNYKKQNQQKISKQMRTYRRENQDVVSASRVSYRTRKLHAVPWWLTSKHKSQIKRIYEEARERTEQTGINYSVDHIVPLQGKEACGLHVPWNLRVITLSRNCSKANKLLT
jgi:cytochrome c553